MNGVPLLGTTSPAMPAATACSLFAATPMRNWPTSWLMVRLLTLVSVAVTVTVPLPDSMTCGVIEFTSSRSQDGWVVIGCGDSAGRPAATPAGNERAEQHHGRRRE